MLRLRLRGQAVRATAHARRDAGLYARLSGVLELLETAGLEHLDDLYPRLLEGVLHAVPNAQAGSLIVRRGSFFRFVATSGFDLEKLRSVRLPAEAVLGVREPLEDGEGIVARAQGEALLRALSTVSEEDARLLKEYGRLDAIEESISGLIRVGGEVFGLITLDRFRGERVTAFEPFDGRLLRIMAQQVASTVTNMQASARLRELDVLRSQFVATTQHELRTPLMTLMGFAELMLKELQSDDLNAWSRKAFMVDAAQRVVQESYRLSQLANDLSALVQAHHVARAVDLAKLMLELNIEYADRARKRQIQYSADTNGLPEIQGDADALRLAIGAVLNNAVSYTLSGHAVRVTASINSAAGEAMAVIRVVDTGIGISAEDLERIFQPFYRGNTQLVLAQRGTGSGLAIARRVLRDHGGDIFAHSIGTGHGATFTLVLPLRRPEVAKPTTSEVIFDPDERALDLEDEPPSDTSELH